MWRSGTRIRFAQESWHNHLEQPSGGALEYQLRTYEVRPGEMDAWIEEWQRGVVPLREMHGFQTVAAWRCEDETSFVWVLSYNGGFAAADAAYYDSPERAAITPDPARHISGAQTKMLRRIL